MKRILAFLLAMIMMISLSACGQTASTEEASTDSSNDSAELDESQFEKVLLKKGSLNLKLPRSLILKRD